MKCLSSSGVAWLVGLIALPFSVAVAGGQEPATTVAPRNQASGTEAPVLRGRVADEAGMPLANVRVRIAIPAADMRFVRVNSPHKRLEVYTDAAGNYRVEVPEIKERTSVSLDALKPGYRRLVGTLMAGGDETKVDLAPGLVAEVNLVLKPALYFSGIVVDEQGQPITGVRISSLLMAPNSTASVETLESNPDGSFELFCYPTQLPLLRNQVTTGTVRFLHPDYIEGKIDDVYALAEGERTRRLVFLGTGQKVSGTVLDATGKPVAGALVRAIPEGSDLRKGTATDAQGQFTIRGLTKGPINLIVRAVAIHQKTQLAVAGDGDKTNLEVRLQPFAIPADLKTLTVLGMRLADVTPELKSAYDLVQPRGAVVIDKGTDADRLQIGPVSEGNCFTMVGNKRIASVRDFVTGILAETIGQDADQYSIRVVYLYSSPDFERGNTTYLKFTRDDLNQLKALADQLAAGTQ